MIYQIVRGKSVLAGILFFMAVFALGLIWAFNDFGGLADAFVIRQTFN
ncbi:MAG: hypothetical protein ACYC21_00635 [Eubacteriales bacterium]